jgi:hypothetical protein
LSNDGAAERGDYAHASTAILCHERAYLAAADAPFYGSITGRVTGVTHAARDTYINDILDSCRQWDMYDHFVNRRRRSGTSGG